jgi:hypothetical protein
MLTSSSWLFQKGSKNSPANSHKIKGRISSIRPFQKVWVWKQATPVISRQMVPLPMKKGSSKQERAGYCSLAYSALACFRIGISESAFFQRLRKS